MSEPVVIPDRAICIEDFCGGGRLPSSFAMDYDSVDCLVYLSGDWGHPKTGKIQILAAKEIDRAEIVLHEEAFLEAVERLRNTL